MMDVSKQPQQGKLENICNNKNEKKRKKKEKKKGKKKNEKRMYQNLLHSAEAAQCT